MAAILSAACILIGGYGIARAYVKCVEQDVIIRDLDEDTQFRSDVRTLAMGQMETSQGSTLAAALRDITLDGYDITGIVAELEHVPPPDDDWWRVRNVPQCDRARLLQARCPPGPRRKLPRFVAACALEMRMKFGSCAPTSANALMAESWYEKVCKDRFVRQIDAAHHRQDVMNAFFGETFDFESASARRRAPRWLLWLRGEETTFTTAAYAC